ncbi:Homeobox protein goosecoid-2-like [Lasiodiplodia theobromae]|uniref:Homeobox protein goosecoid-2-like n=1 Tax=Lasiodiplodia theobromae TaxID=45133 RepID=UPI0015C2D81F|nr:Homeobox protein goosecoid-2-like [Lasiodiplodia theobromae]KAF4541307.1 Homeobox protein goosecoid-2-like [Lasiodiplodia theobromae]
MNDIRSWLGSGDPPLLDSLLDLPDTLNCTENHTIENMDLSWFDDKTFIGESSLFGGYNSSNPIGPDEPATQIQPEPFSSNILQETDFPGLENLPEVVVGESHDSLLQKAGPHVLADPDVDQTTTNEQNKRRPGSPTLQPSKRNGPISSQSSKRRTKLSPDAKKVLEEFFAHNIYPEPNDVAKLVEQTGAEEQQIKTWFRNQRSRKLNFGKYDRTSYAAAGSL